MISSLLAKIRTRIFGRRKVSTLDPDEIFLDSSNLPEFDTSQFEGRLEHPIGKKTFTTLSIFFLAIALVFLGRLWFLQINSGMFFVEQSEKNRLDHSLIFTERGVIYDRGGTELAWNVPGEDTPKREYTTLSGLSHVLGYIQEPLKDNKDIYYQVETIGLAGVEKVFDKSLKGENGLKIVETDVFGEIQSESIFAPPVDGENVILSIDAELQSKFYEFIEELANGVSFVGGAGTIMDIENGEIIALTSFPEYSSSVLSDGNDTNTIAQYIHDESKPFLNRVISGLYTPGSIVKPFLALGALHSGVIDEDKKILSTGSISIENPYVPGTFTIFNDWKAHGEVNIKEALAVSSNVYFFEVGGGYKDQKGMGIENIEKYVRLFDLGEDSGVDLPSEVEGIIPNPSWKEANFEDGTWRIGDTYNTAIGQYGFQITPIQAVRAISAIANDGVLLTPTLIKDKRVHKETIPIPDEYFKIVKEGMRLAVTDGTAGGLNIASVKVAAKTGTAEVGSKKKFVNSWIIGFFPYEKPKYAFAVLMERGPVENLTGGVFVARQLLEWVGVNRPEYLEY